MYEHYSSNTFNSSSNRNSYASRTLIQQNSQKQADLLILHSYRLACTFYLIILLLVRLMLVILWWRWREKPIWTWYSSARPADCQRPGWMTGGRQLCVCPRAPPITRRVPVKGRMTAGKINQPTHHTLSHLSIYFLGLEKFLNFVKVRFLRTACMLLLSTTESQNTFTFHDVGLEKKNKNKNPKNPSTSNTSYNHKRIPHLPTSIQPFPPSQPPHRLIRALSTLSTLPPLSSFLLPPSLSLHSLAVLQQLVLLSLSYFFAPHLFFYFSSWIGRWDNIS